MQKIDESLYSRQLYVIGKDAMEKMMNSRILVIGMDGLGQEVVKNLCLMGVSHISIFDKEKIKEEDYAIGFYFKKASLGEVRDASLVHKFRSLNEYVQVEVVDSLESFKEYDLVIVCDEQMSKQVEMNRRARRDSCKYISCQVRGLFSQVFCDFGTDFVCLDQTGEIPVTGMINDITPEGVLTVVEGQRHGLEDGDIIRILHKEEYEGSLFKVQSLNHSSMQLHKIDGISIMDIENESTKPFKFTEVYGGDFEQVKKPKMLHFRSLEEAIEQPKILSYHFGDLNREEVIHKCFLALSDYLQSFGVFPNANNFLSYFIKKHENLYEYETLIREFGRQSNTTLMPIVSIVGGFVAQEALKAISFKFNPVNQFLYFDALEVLHNVEEREEEKYEGRYGSLLKIFGKENVEKLFALKIFLVGSGAIGCEHLKNLVMCGMGTEGEINVTDMDSIEQSNLTRQFLFSKGDVSKMKAEVAVREVKKLNEDFGAKANGESSESTKKVKSQGSTVLKYFNLKVGQETEEVFSDQFFKRMDIVANALDNVEARLYIDSRCLLSRKHLVDAGTSGTKGNVQVVVPYYTEPYGASRDPPEKSIPLCTIKNFPHAIEHTIEWAMSEFRFRFHDQILSIRDYLEDPSSHQEESEEEMDEVTKKISGISKETIQDVVREIPRNVEGCIKSALMLFVRYFHTSIKQLLTTFPPDSKTKEGQPFWMPPKRAPTPINFDVSNDLHVTFVLSVANIYSMTFGINQKIPREKVVDFITNHILAPENDCSNINSTIVTNISTDTSSANTSSTNNNFSVAEFEKDDDSNFHVDFVYSAANLRASNYKIKNSTRLEIKGIAGRIIPAIATTTAVVSGLATLEMIKMAIGVPNNKFKNYFLNLALPFFASSDPLEASKQTYKIEDKSFSFTVWNRLEYKDTKLSNILKAFEIQFKRPLTMITAENSLIYWDIDDRYKKNLDLKISQIVPQAKGKMFVALDALTDNDEEEFPRIIVLYDQ
ncbi:Ubiquitin-activating enzyme E1 1 [Nosema granulosis]|uniref:Ubiquitin-activating enzyme E1 1 n=1 Tax=Nosema granulosis TaxID=83296 RepID=A0A9P6H1S8_9MICR|nr:Ubiquitin-activating enzyme E1 1 [Nosema granulosis]